MYEYLIGAGEMKAGTTLLYSLLLKHPEIRRGARKELHYFDTQEQPDKAEYDRLFCEGTGLKMDVTPFYMYYPASLERMERVLDPKKVAVVVLLRDPVERAFSHYRMRKSQGMEDLSFAQAFDREPERTARSFHDLQLYSYFTRGLYAAQLENLYRVFPKENVRVYLFENFVKGQQAHVDDLCDFAGIGRIRVQDMHANKTVSSVKSPLLARLVRKAARMVPKGLRRDWMGRLRRFVCAFNEKKGAREEIDPAFEQKLIAYYRADVDLLRERFGLDVSPWARFSRAS